jgi:hypothetical protein
MSDPGLVSAARMACLHVALLVAEDCPRLGLTARRCSIAPQILMNEGNRHAALPHSSALRASCSRASNSSAENNGTALMSSVVSIVCFEWQAEGQMMKP